jgi:hypothetical protein
MPLALRNCWSGIRTSSPSTRKSNGRAWWSGSAAKKQKRKGLEPQGGHPTDGMESWGSSRSGRSPTARRPLTISESPMRERSAGTAMAVVGTRSGDGSFVTKRTRTWRDGSATMAAAEKVFACSNGVRGLGERF